MLQTQLVNRQNLLKPLKFAAHAQCIGHLRYQTTIGQARAVAKTVAAAAMAAQHSFQRLDSLFDPVLVPRLFLLIADCQLFIQVT